MGHRHVGEFGQGSLICYSVCVLAIAFCLPVKPKQHWGHPAPPAHRQALTSPPPPPPRLFATRLVQRAQVLLQGVRTGGDQATERQVPSVPEEDPASAASFLRIDTAELHIIGGSPGPTLPDP